jgi:CRISPR-associated protein Csb2
LESKVLPSVVSTLEIAERVRRKLMGIHKAIVGDPAKVSPSFSGKDPVGRPLQGHQHVYILPQDRNHDGRLDHVMVICRTPLDEAEQFALDRLETIWQSHGKPDIRFIPIRWGSRDQLLSPAYRFASVTPLVLTRHYRQGRGEFTEWLATEICRELGNQGLPQPVQIMFLPKFSYRGGRSHRWLEFRRNRKEDQVRPGYGFELEFAEEVAGPFLRPRRANELKAEPQACMLFDNLPSPKLQRSQGEQTLNARGLRIAGCRSHAARFSRRPVGPATGTRYGSGRTGR